MNKTTKASINRRLFRKLSLFTFVFVCLQLFSGMIHIVQPFPFSSMIINFTHDVLRSWVIMSGFGYFVLAQFIIYLIYTSIITAVALLVSHLLRLNDKMTIRFGLALWILCTVTLFLANQMFFPWSIFAFLTGKPILLLGSKIVFYLLSSIILAFVLLAIISIGQIIIKNNDKLFIRFILVMLIVAAPVLIFAKNKLLAQPVYTGGQPNIIIIGIDSLRPDYTGAVDPRTSVTPHIDEFLQDAAIFNHAYTPLARTFPTWMSIMTSENPIVSGIREELPDLNSLKVDNTLANNLRAAGYTTLYATDDRRFNHMSERIGFDKVIAAKTGFNDFVLGSFNDFPLSNLLMNSFVGRWLFPYTYANRSANVTYFPSTYLSFLDSSLSEYKKRPLFLAIHLTLPHWPFIWADTTLAKTKSDVLRDQYYYRQSVIEADDQFGKLVTVLQKQQLLHNSIVFVISDHGQSLGFANERSTDPSKYLAGNNKLAQTNFKFFTQPTFGHGTDLLNAAQYDVLFAVRSFDTAEKIYPGHSNQITSLLDIKPTILDYLQLPIKDAQGISLLPWLTQSDNTKIVARDLYEETGFTLPGILVANPSIEKTLRQGLGYYRIDPRSGSVVIKEIFEPMIVRGKQRAVLNYPWELACYPVNDKVWLLTLANMQTRQWTTDLTSPMATQAHADQMLAKLKSFFGKEYMCK